MAAASTEISDERRIQNEKAVEGLRKRKAALLELRSTLVSKRSAGSPGLGSPDGTTEVEPKGLAGATPGAGSAGAAADAEPPAPIIQPPLADGEIENVEDKLWRDALDAGKAGTEPPRDVWG